MRHRVGLPSSLPACVHGVVPHEMVFCRESQCGGLCCVALRCVPSSLQHRVPVSLTLFLLSKNDKRPAQMTIVGWNAAMHAASIVGQPGKALEFLEEAKVGNACGGEDECSVGSAAGGTERERKTERDRERETFVLLCLPRWRNISTNPPQTRNFLGFPECSCPPPPPVRVRKQARGVKPTEVTYATAIGACAKATTDKKANGRKVRMYVCVSPCVCVPRKTISDFW